MSIADLIVLMCLMLLGAAVGKPLGWVTIGLALLAFLLALFGGALGLVR